MAPGQPPAECHPGELGPAPGSPRPTLPLVEGGTIRQILQVRSTCTWSLTSKTPTDLFSCVTQSLLHVETSCFCEAVRHMYANLCAQHTDLLPTRVAIAALQPPVWVCKLLRKRQNHPPCFGLSSEKGTQAACAPCQHKGLRPRWHQPKSLNRWGVWRTWCRTIIGICISKLGPWPRPTVAQRRRLFAQFCGDFLGNSGMSTVQRNQPASCCESMPNVLRAVRSAQGF